MCGEPRGEESCPLCDVVQSIIRSFSAFGRCQRCYIWGFASQYQEAERMPGLPSSYSKARIEGLKQSGRLLQGTRTLQGWCREFRRCIYHEREKAGHVVLALSFASIMYIIHIEREATPFSRRAGREAIIDFPRPRLRLLDRITPGIGSCRSSCQDRSDAEALAVRSHLHRGHLIGRTLPSSR